MFLRCFLLQSIPYSNLLVCSQEGCKVLWWVCPSICLSVHPHISETTRPHFIDCFVHVACGRGTVLLWPRCDTLCLSSFMDDVMFSHNGCIMVELNSRNCCINSNQILLSSTRGGFHGRGGEVWRVRLRCRLYDQAASWSTGLVHDVSPTPTMMDLHSSLVSHVAPHVCVCVCVCVCACPKCRSNESVYQSAIQWWESAMWTV